MPPFGPELSKFVKSHFPVARKRSALWFFTNEIKNNIMQHAQNTLPVSQTKTKYDGSSSEACENVAIAASISSSITTRNNYKVPAKISRNKILLLWKNMDPESKRKYFNMAEFDSIRYNEQKCLWVAVVGAQLMKNAESLNKLGELAPTHETLQNEFLESLDNLHRSYERMIQAESTKTLYKDAIKKVESEQCTQEDDLMNAIPEQHRPILSQPRRPPPVFVLYLNDNLEKYKAERPSSGGSYMKQASEDWAKLDPKIKSIYEERYQKLRDDYIKAMQEYRVNLISDDSGELVDQATREKRAFRKSLRKRLRDASILPLSIRNAFNFFLMEHKDIKLTDLTEIWRNLSDDKKMKYIEMSRADEKRYRSEMAAYKEIKMGLSQLMSRTKLSSEPDAGSERRASSQSPNNDDLKDKSKLKQ